MMTEDFYGETFVTLVKGLDKDDLTQLTEYLQVRLRIGYHAIYLYQFKRFVAEIVFEEECVFSSLVDAASITREIRDLAITNR